MGTRSLTHVVSNEFGKEQILCTIYRQYDGYPDGHGADIAQFLSSRHLVNGIGEDKNVFNGAGCLAAQLVSILKLGASAAAHPLVNNPDPTTSMEPGGIYLTAPGAKDCGEEYTYTVTATDFETITFKVESTYGHEDSFEGTPQEFLDWLKERA